MSSFFLSFSIGLRTSGEQKRKTLLAKKRNLDINRLESAHTAGKRKKTTLFRNKINDFLETIVLNPRALCRVGKKLTILLKPKKPDYF